MFRLKRILITARKISSCTLATGTVCTTVSEPTYSVRQTARGFLRSLGLSQPTGRARNQWHSSTRSVIGAVSKAPAVSFSREMVGAFAEIRKWQSACFASGGPRGFAFQSVDMRTMRSPSHGRMVMRSYANDAAKTLKVYKPTSPGQRGRIITLRANLWKGKPYKPLTRGLVKTGGRNNHGRITVWHRGGGHKRLYRMVDFQRKLRGVLGTVRRIEYDPNRTTRIALVDFQGHNPAYMLATDGMKAGDTVTAGDEGVDIRPGNAMPLGAMPVGTLIHNIELRPGQGGKLVRAAGAVATLVKKGDDGYATVRLPSGEQRLVLSRCFATVGTLSNREHQNRKLGKAGASRWLGVRPTTRGVAMNPVDHPHGGGEGRTSGGRPSCTPWGVQTKGKKTRNNKRTDVFRVARRPTGKKKKG